MKRFGVPQRFERSSGSGSRQEALGAFAVRARFGQRFERRGIENDDSTMFEANPASRSPDPQLLVDAFPGHPAPLADFLLRDGNCPSARPDLVILGQTNQRTGEPPRQILQD